MMKIPVATIKINGSYHDIIVIKWGSVTPILSMHTNVGDASFIKLMDRSIGMCSVTSICVLLPSVYPILELMKYVWCHL